ncbi:MAG: YadA-like family protein, partial [Fusobacterium sp.]|nr:YadA-like family protein [Fusobacterium sp.]
EAKKVVIHAKDKKPVTNIASNLPGTTDVTTPAVTEVSRTKPTNVDAIKNNAATVDDVLNAGWNLEGNDTAVDFVKAYDTVNFKDGLGTKARVETDAKNEVNKVFYDVAVDNETTKLVGSKDGKDYVQLANGSWAEYDKATGQPKVNGATLTEAPTDVKVVAAKAAKSTVVTAGDGVTVTPTAATATEPAKYKVAAKVDGKTIKVNNNGQLEAVASKETNITLNEKETTLGENYNTDGNLLGKATKDANGIETVNIKLNDKVTLGKDGNQVVVDGTSGTVKVGKGDKQVTVNGKEGTVTGLTNKTWEVGKTKPVSGRAATEDQLKVLDNELAKVSTEAAKKSTETVSEGEGIKVTQTPEDKKQGANYEVSLADKGIKEKHIDPDFLKLLKKKSIELSKVVKGSEFAQFEPAKPRTDGTDGMEYVLNIDKDELAKQLVTPESKGTLEDGLDLTYKANGKDAKQTSLKDGLDFTNGEYTKATVGPNGKVVIDVDKAKLGKLGVSPFEKVYDKDGNPTDEIRAKGDKPQRVTNIAAGEKDTDAVNVSQLNQVKGDVNGLKNEIGGLKGGLANAAAMSTLEFLEIGINQATIGAAVGTYRGNQAVAVGMQAAPSQNTRVHAKVSVNPDKGHENTMAGVGASWRFNWK